MRRQKTIYHDQRALEVYGNTSLFFDFTLIFQIYSQGAQKGRDELNMLGVRHREGGSVLLLIMSISEQEVKQRTVGCRVYFQRRKLVMLTLLRSTHWRVM